MTAPGTPGQSAGQARRHRRVGSRLAARDGHGRAALPAGRNAGEACSPAARSAASRSAVCCCRSPTSFCSTSRRTISMPSRWVARAASAAISRHGHRRHARPLLPRQRRRLDPRARSRRRAFRGRATTRRGSSRSRSVCSSEEKSESQRQKTLQRELEWIRMSPKGRHAKGKARINRVRGAAQPGDAGEGRKDLEIYIPPGPRLGSVVIEADDVRKALRRQAARRRHDVHASARRHRRRDRSERRRQDHALPDDHRAGAAGRRNDSRRRDGEARLRRSEPHARSRQDDLRGDHRRRRPRAARARAR